MKITNNFNQAYNNQSQPKFGFTLGFTKEAIDKVAPFLGKEDKELLSMIWKKRACDGHDVYIKITTEEDENFIKLNPFIGEENSSNPINQVNIIIPGDETTNELYPDKTLESAKKIKFIENFQKGIEEIKYKIDNEIEQRKIDAKIAENTKYLEDNYRVNEKYD
jgi:hypothetical protein